MPANLYYEEAMELHLELYAKDMYHFDMKYYDGNQRTLRKVGRQALADKNDERELITQNYFHAIMSVDELKALIQG